MTAFDVKATAGFSCTCRCGQRHGFAYVTITVAPGLHVHGILTTDGCRLSGDLLVAAENAAQQAVMTELKQRFVSRRQWRDEQIKREKRL
jgi:metal-sulfur cluster biosynthetic enzyme